MRVVVDGAIACGKSTLLRGLSEFVAVRLEPVEKWTPALELFYKDPPAHAHALNMMCMEDLARRDLVPSESLVMAERSIHSSFHVFGALARERGLIDRREHTEMFERYMQLADVDRMCDITFVFLDVPSDVSIDRIALRNQSEVLAEDKQYFRDVARAYRRFYRDVRLCGAAEVTVLDGRSSPDRLVSHVRGIIEKKCVPLGLPRTFTTI